MNDSRATWAGEALNAFQRLTGTDDGDILYDLLCDLMHWSDRNGVDFAETIEKAKRCYADETRAK